MTRRLVMIMAILWIAGFAQAKNMHWKDLSEYLKNKPVTVRAAEGIEHYGCFVATSVDSIVVDEGYLSARIKIPRRSVLFLTRHATRDSHVGALVVFAASLGLAPRPIVIVAAPAGFLVFIAGLPLCALMDVFDRRPYKDVTIKLLPDKK